MKKLLLIEDDTVLRENTSELLDLAGYNVIAAADGKQGLLAAKENAPDAIICDIMMPELDGYGVLEALNKDVKTKRIPFIFLSAKTERKDVRKGMELGADDYLTKPFTESELIGAIESRLAKVAIMKDMQRDQLGTTTQDMTGLKTIHDLKNFMDDNGVEYSFQLGDTIYQEGDNSNIVYLVLRGAVKTHKLDEQGKELITAIYNPDDFFGLSSFIRNTPYREYATAMENTELVGISKDSMKSILEENHDLAMELIQLLSDNLSETKDQLLQMAYGSVRKKTAATILKFAEKLQEDAKGNIHILRSDLASVAGIATETLIRTLSSFKEEGLIRIENRNIKILDLDQLRKIQ